MEGLTCMSVRSRKLKGNITNHMHILVTNDDGVTAPGLLALARAMRRLGKVSILAPDRNWSGGGHVKTLDRPLRIKEVSLADGTTAMASDGAPSDCVALALLGNWHWDHEETDDHDKHPDRHRAIRDAGLELGSVKPVQPL
jgi:broad specificity polyphosphatase/5'/3'-nucleotidase SurE